MNTQDFTDLKLRDLNRHTVNSKSIYTSGKKVYVLMNFFLFKGDRDSMSERKKTSMLYLPFFFICRKSFPQFKWSQICDYRIDM